VSDDSTTECLLFPGIFCKPVVAQFDQREGSSDGGALLLKAANQHYRLVEELTACLRDERQAGKVDHTACAWGRCPIGPSRCRRDSHRQLRTRAVRLSPDFAIAPR